MKVEKQVFPGLRNEFEQIKEYQNFADDLFDTKDDVQYMKTFIDYVLMKLLKRISKKIGHKKKPGKSSKIFQT
jgi:hypothetical protein